MENTIVACVQQRMSIMASHEEFEAAARRFLRQAQAKAAQLVVFPELSGVMLAPPLISGFKLGFIKRADRGYRPSAGGLSRGLGRVSGAAAGVLGGGFRGSLIRLLEKNSDALRDVYLETYGALAREYGTAILAGSLYLLDPETRTVRNQAYLFDVDGEVLGFQEKLNLAPDEEELATAGTDLHVFETRFGRLGVLIGRDALYPELARLLAIQGAELIVGIAAAAGQAQARMVRSALGLRAEENQVYAAVSFLLGPNHLGQASREDFFGQSAILAPISLTERGDGVLIQTGTDRTEGLIASELDAEALRNLWETSRFRPRARLNVGNLGLDLADFYREGLTIEEAVQRHVAVPVEAEYPAEPLPELDEGQIVDLAEELQGPVDLEAADLAEELPEPVESSSDVFLPSVPEAMSLTGSQVDEEEDEEQGD